MNQNTGKVIYVLYYAVGDYSDRSEETVAAMFDGVAANNLANKFNEIREFYNNRHYEYFAERERWTKEWVNTNGPLQAPQIDALHGKLKKMSRPDWAAMTNTAWQKFLDAQKTKAKADNQSYAERFTQQREWVDEQTKKFWDEARKLMSPDLTEYLPLYTWSEMFVGNFMVAEVPIWHPMA